MLKQFMNISEFPLLENKFIDLQLYEKHEKISQNQYSKFFTISNKNDGSKYLAKISKEEINFFLRHEVINFTREVNIYIKLNHPSILKFLGYSPTNFKKDLKPSIITEYASNWTLYNFLEEQREEKTFLKYNDTKKLIIIYGIAAGMLYLHSNDIIHCNLQPTSIYLDHQLSPKISEFGLAKEFSQTKQLNDSEIRISIEYTAPELLKTLKYSKSTDIYAFSIIVYEIITNKKPFFV